MNGQFSARSGTSFLKDFGQGIFNGFDADGKLPGNRFVTGAGGQQGSDLALARREYNCLVDVAIHDFPQWSEAIERNEFHFLARDTASE